MSTESNDDLDPLADTLSRALGDIEGASYFRWDRDRPYNGQPWTVFGESGKTIISGLTERDIADCFVRGLMDCMGVDQPELRDIADRAVWGNMYDVRDLNRVDPGAWVQNALIRMEEMMGIRPDRNTLAE
ncbi:MAG: hypothetical protein E6Q97_30130 [Desulfurellales bacterium]|nr:MAG: hypothetical protein E6Q97_30130 [Desulfurellales bacterium]